MFGRQMPDLTHSTVRGRAEEKATQPIAKPHLSRRSINIGRALVCGVCRASRHLRGPSHTLHPRPGYFLAFLPSAEYYQELSQRYSLFGLVVEYIGQIDGFGWGLKWQIVK